ncbi:hypothetical protein EJ08DRAFT_3053 [Tothia fuscella]|uniref:Uncharacterized protein n=1 Tax=Tothia fuscella TaxID=1048955 RepID=A0A9P4U4B4_9PEZI|nr:hypothetical protein EJ08DRAFT_3053 [Tothia fuscella]
MADQLTETPSLPAQNAPTIQDLQANKTLWYKLHVFIHDLHNFSTNPSSHSRLDSVVDPSYISLPYFTPSEVTLLKSTVIENDKTFEQIIQETLIERLNRTTKKRVESSDCRTCAAHDFCADFREGAWD